MNKKFEKLVRDWVKSMNRNPKVSSEGRKMDKKCINNQCFHNKPEEDNGCSLVTGFQLCKVKRFVNVYITSCTSGHKLPAAILKKSRTRKFFLMPYLNG